MRGSRLRLLALPFCVFAIGCGSSSDDEDGSGGGASAEDPLTVGFAIDKSSFLEPYDVPAKTAAEIAIEEINADGGVLGRQLTTTDADTKSIAENSANAGIEVLEDGAEFMVTTCDFDLGGPAAREAQNRGVLAFATCAGSLKFGPTGIGPLAFTMGVPGVGEGAIMAEFGYEDKGLRKAYTLLDPTIDYESQLCDGFTQRFEQLGGEIVGSDTFQQEDQSIGAQVSRIKSTSDADMIFLCSYMPGEAKAVRQIRSAGIDLPILGGQDFDGDFWKEAVPDLSNVYFTSYASIYGDDPETEVNEFFETYEEEAGELPDTGSAITGYSVMEAFALAAERAGSTEGAALQAELEKFQDEEFLEGKTSFDEEFHISINRPMRIMQIQNGETSFVTIGEPDEVPVPQG